MELRNKASGAITKAVTMNDHPFRNEPPDQKEQRLVREIMSRDAEWTVEERRALATAVANLQARVDLMHTEILGLMKQAPAQAKGQ